MLQVQTKLAKSNKPKGKSGICMKNVEPILNFNWKSLTFQFTARSALAMQCRGTDFQLRHRQSSKNQPLAPPNPPPEAPKIAPRPPKLTPGPHATPLKLHVRSVHYLQHYRPSRRSSAVNSVWIWHAPQMMYIVYGFELGSLKCRI